MGNQERGITPEHPVLVTGGAGFIGSNLIEKLNSIDPNLHIVSIDNYFTGLKENHITSANINYLEGYTKNISEIWKKIGLSPPNFVFHLGEYSRIPQSFGDFDKVWEFNIDGTKEVVKFCGDNSSKIVYAGSSSKFGNSGEDENLSPYAWMKSKNTELIKNYKKWFKLDYVITYFYNVYGLRQIKEGKYATVIGKFEEQYKNKKPLTVVGKGEQTRDFTHISDIIEGIIICAQKGENDEFQLGRGQELTILEVAKMFNTEIDFVAERKGERQRGCSDSNKARQLGWEPKLNLSDYIADFINKTK